MKWRNRVKRLRVRKEAYEESMRQMMSYNSRKARGYHKPGSMKK